VSDVVVVDGGVDGGGGNSVGDSNSLEFRLKRF